LDWESLAQEPHAYWQRLHRELLSIRQRTVVPFLRNRSSVLVRQCDCKNRALAIDWTFEDGAKLELCANLGSAEAAVEKGGGRLFYASHPQAAGTLKLGCLPPWFVAWSVAKSVA
jgi:maltooligosyltrehalose trehalohydrolase